MLQIDALSEENSLEFFHSSFRVNSPECDDQFKSLHKVTEGYPLVMNLAASNIDSKRRRNDGSVRELQQKINGYIADLELEKESGKILNEEMKHWPTSYKKTLSAAWQLTFQRLEQEANGPKALEVLQIMSFLKFPIKSDDVRGILTLGAAWPHPVIMELQLEELFYLLERFYAARILKIPQDYAEGFQCYVGIHRLVQLAVRQQTDCSQVLEGIICQEVLYLDEWKDNAVNTSALHDAMKTANLTPRALASVGILACAGDPIARDIVQNRRPETKAAETVWRLYDLERGMTTLNAAAVQVITELIELMKSAEVLGDRHMYFKIAVSLLLGRKGGNFSYVREDGTKVKDFFHSTSGIMHKRDNEKLACKLISDFGSSCFQNLHESHLHSCRCVSCICSNEMSYRFHPVSFLFRKLIEEFVYADVQQSESMRTQLTHAILNCIPVLKQDDWQGDFWYEMSEAVGISQSRMAELRTSLWDHGLAEKLEHIFQCHHHSNDIEYEKFFLAKFMGKFESVQKVQETFLLLVNLLLDVFLDGMDSTDQRVQQVMLAFTETTARVLAQIGDGNDETRFHFMCDVCSVWILLILMGEPSECLLELLSRCEALTWLEGDISGDREFIDRRYTLVDSATRRFNRPFSEVLKPKVSQYVKKYSSSEVKRMQTLVAFWKTFFSLEGYLP